MGFVGFLGKFALACWFAFNVTYNFVVLIGV